MRIERLLPPAQPGRPWTVVLEGGDALRVPEGTVAAFSLYDGLTLEEERLAVQNYPAFLATHTDTPVDHHYHRMLYDGHLQEKLMAKGATDRQAAEVVAWALEIGLLNEEEYAKTLARHYQARGYGMYKIKDELYHRQVPRRYWEQALAELEDPEEFIDAFLARKVQDPGDRKQIKKASDALVRRGFSWRQVSEGVARLRWGD